MVAYKYQWVFSGCSTLAAKTRIFVDESGSPVMGGSIATVGVKGGESGSCTRVLGASSITFGGPMPDVQPPAPVSARGARVSDSALDPGAGADGWGLGLVDALPAHGDACLVTHRRDTDIALHHGECAPLWALA